MKERFYLTCECGRRYTVWFEVGTIGADIIDPVTVKIEFKEDSDEQTE